MINDEKAYYDMSKHKYILKKEYLEDKLNVNLNDILSHDLASVSNDRDVQIFIERISDSLYDFIYAYSENADAYEYYLSLSDTVKQRKNRDVLIECLVEHAYDIIQNNKEIAIYFHENGDLKDSIAPAVKSHLQGNDLLTRAKLTNLPYGYIELRGVKY